MTDKPITPQARSLYERLYGEVVSITLSNTSEFTGKFVGLEMNQFGGMTIALGPNTEISWPVLLVRVGMDESFSVQMLTSEDAILITEPVCIFSGDVK